MTLTRLECRWAEAAMEAIFPGAAEIGLDGIRSMNAGAFFRDLLPTLPWRAAVGVRLAVWLVAFAPWFFFRRFATIARIGMLERERVISALIASPWYAVRSLAMLLKALGALVYAADDRVRARMAPSRARLVRLRKGAAPA